MKVLVFVKDLYPAGTDVNQAKMTILFSWITNQATWEPSERVEVDFSGVATVAALRTAIAALVKAKIEANPKFGGQTADLIQFP